MADSPDECSDWGLPKPQHPFCALVRPDIFDAYSAFEAAAARLRTPLFRDVQPFSSFVPKKEAGFRLPAFALRKRYLSVGPMPGVFLFPLAGGFLFGIDRRFRDLG